ncbi:MAG: hypothetical protein D6733_06255 [Methanobacteriota archaeon]|nr:MAG: hypothetical protein D6733_06255 [Euryarchaeota archaeon]
MFPIPVRSIPDRLRTFYGKLGLEDKASLAIVSVHLILLFLNWSRMPNDQKDWTYHLMISKMFVEKGSFLWDVYEYAPVGRPHLYPPLLHTIFAVTHLLGVDWLNVQRLYGIVIYVLSLLVLWFVMRDFFGGRVALLSVLMLSLSESYFWWQVSAAPTSLVFALYPLLIWAFLRHEKMAILILSAMFWTHLASPWLAVLAIFIYSLLKGEMRRFFKVTGIALLSFLPWAVHVLRYRSWIHHEAMTVTGANIELVMGVFGLIGLYMLAKRRGAVETAVLAGVVALIPTAYAYSWRFWIHFPTLFAGVSALGLKKVADDIGEKGFPAAVLLLILLSFTASPSVSIQGMGEKTLPIRGALPRGGEPEAPAATYIMSLREVRPPLAIEMSGLMGEGRLLRTSPHISEDAMAVYGWIERNTLPDEILHVDDGFTGCAISLFTGRRTDNGAWKEVIQQWVVGEARDTQVRYGVIRIKPGQRLSEESVIERFGGYVVVDMERFRKEQPHAPRFILEMMKLGESLRDAGRRAGGKPEEASRILRETTSKVRVIASEVPQAPVKVDLLRTAGSMERLADGLEGAPQAKREETARLLEEAASSLERGDVRGAGLILCCGRERPMP